MGNLFIKDRITPIKSMKVKRENIIGQKFLIIRKLLEFIIY